MREQIRQESLEILREINDLRLNLIKVNPQVDTELIYALRDLIEDYTNYLYTR